MKPDAINNLSQTVELIKRAAPSVTIEQYGLRGHEGQAVMEFAIGGCLEWGGVAYDADDDINIDDGVETPLDRIFEALNESENIGVVRRIYEGVSEKHKSFADNSGGRE